MLEIVPGSPARPASPPGASAGGVGRGAPATDSTARHGAGAGRPLSKFGSTSWAASSGPFPSRVQSQDLCLCSLCRATLGSCRLERVSFSRFPVESGCPGVLGSAQLSGECRPLVYADDIKERSRSCLLPSSSVLSPPRFSHSGLFPCVPKWPWHDLGS